MFIKILLTCIGGYVVGTFNPAYLIGKSKGIDIREEGTGNAGSTNATFILGKKAGITVFFSDILKTILIMSLVGVIWPEDPFLMALAGVSCFIGHAFPFYLQFKGGKGSACFLGMLLRLSPGMLPVMLLIATLIAFITDVAYFLPVSGIIMYPIVLWLLKKDVITIFLAALLIPLTLYLHRMNLGKVKSGEENGFREVLLGKVKGYGKNAIRKGDEVVSEEPEELAVK